MNQGEFPSKKMPLHWSTGILKRSQTKSYQHKNVSAAAVINREGTCGCFIYLWYFLAAPARCYCRRVDPSCIVRSRGDRIPCHAASGTLLHQPLHATADHAPLHAMLAILTTFFFFFSRLAWWRLLGLEFTTSSTVDAVLQETRWGVSEVME